MQAFALLAGKTDEFVWGSGGMRHDGRRKGWFLLVAASFFQDALNAGEQVWIDVT